MKPPERKWPQSNVAGQKPQRPATPAHQSRPAVAQAKNTARPMPVRVPAAPPVYRPQPKPPVLQRKEAGASPTKTPPAAPPVYRPQPTPRRLQAKAAAPVRPGVRVTGLVQAKMAAPPAVARPFVGRVVQLAAEKLTGEMKKASQFTGGFRQMGHSDVKMPAGGMATFGQLAIEVDDGDEGALITLGASKNVSVKGAHAEDVMIGILREHGGMFDPAKVNPIHMSVTKSPCSSTYGTSKKKQGCTESLIDLITNGVSMGGGQKVQFALTLHVTHLYGGSGDRKRASCNALKALKSAGAEVKLTNDSIVMGERCDLS